jgi:hypothetical protein
MSVKQISPQDTSSSQTPVPPQEVSWGSWICSCITSAMNCLIDPIIGIFSSLFCCSATQHTAPSLNGRVTTGSTSSIASVSPEEQQTQDKALEAFWKEHIFQLLPDPECEVTEEINGLVRDKNPVTLSDLHSFLEGLKQIPSLGEESKRCLQQLTVYFSEALKTSENAASIRHWMATHHTELEKVTCLKLSEGPFPIEVGLLTNLTDLEIVDSSDQKTLPDIFSTLKELRYVSISSEALTSLPLSFVELPYLNKLILNTPNLKNLPHGFGSGFLSLTTIDLTKLSQHLLFPDGLENRACLPQFVLTPQQYQSNLDKLRLLFPSDGYQMEILKRHSVTIPNASRPYQVRDPRITSGVISSYELIATSPTSAPVDSTLKVLNIQDLMRFLILIKELNTDFPLLNLTLYKDACLMFISQKMGQPIPTDELDPLLYPETINLITTQYLPLTEKIKIKINRAESTLKRLIPNLSPCFKDIASIIELLKQNQKSHSKENIEKWECEHSLLNALTNSLSSEEEEPPLTLDILETIDAIPDLAPSLKEIIPDLRKAVELRTRIIHTLT